jgi:hypothetical protein
MGAVRSRPSSEPCKAGSTVITFVIESTRSHLPLGTGGANLVMRHLQLLGLGVRRIERCGKRVDLLHWEVRDAEMEESLRTEPLRC